MPDFGDDEWKGMCCVEAVNCLRESRMLLPGNRHRTCMEILGRRGVEGPHPAPLQSIFGNHSVKQGYTPWRGNGERGRIYIIRIVKKPGVKGRYDEHTRHKKNE
ncbi:MAG: hypothetical protein PF795_12825 [Kiritimatiellae bacterium]|nr:hypothetical protein [Kiritimatiellia bacterium]